jgi:quinone-modifying oxidoreductase subunit QmoA
MAEAKGQRGSILVMGGGVAGLTTAVEAAEAGLRVHLVEKEPYLGGRVARINRYFPKLCPPICGMEINFRRLRANPLISVYTMAEVEEVRGTSGDFTVRVGIRPRYVNERCTGCGKCADVCETETPNPFDYGMSKIKAAYLPHPMAYPMRYVLAPEIIGTPEAEACRDACPYGAIELDMKPKTLELKVSSIVIATGWEPYDATRLENLGFGKYPNVINNVMMERLTSPDGPTGGRVLRPSDWKEIRSIAFCQCAGSRDENHLPFCSRVCCLASMKQALYVREQYPDAQIYIFYIDLRAMGRNEDFLARTQQDGSIHFIKGKVAKITEDPHSRALVLEAEDVAGGSIYRIQVDMAVLATGMVPTTTTMRIPGLNARCDEEGFMMDSEGVLGVGCVKQPLDVASTVQDSTGAALKAIQCAVRR